MLLRTCRLFSIPANPRDHGVFVGGARLSKFKNASAFLPRRAQRVSAFHCARLRSAGGFYLSGEDPRFYKRRVKQYPARLSGGFQSPTEINAPRGCAGIRFGRCQLTLTRIPRQFSRARIESRTPRRSCRDVRGASAPSTAHVCDPPEAFILHREIVLTMKASFTLRAYLTTKVASIAR